MNLENRDCVVFMDLALDIDTLSLWLMNYGSFVLFGLLLLGIIALPIPEETLMVLAGILMHSGKLSIPSTVIASILGAMCGISVSYMLGKTAGHYLVVKYGRWVGITKVRLHKAHQWFERFGWALLVGYFIPGVRHLTGLCAGTSDFSYRQFALYAYSGAAVWVAIFLSIGYFFGKQWLSLYERIEIGSELIVLIASVLVFVVLICVYKVFRKK